MLRAAVRAGTEIGKQVRRCVLKANVRPSDPLVRQAKVLMSKGQLVPDSMITELIRQRIRQPGSVTKRYSRGFPGETCAKAACMPPSTRQWCREI